MWMIMENNKFKKCPNCGADLYKQRSTDWFFTCTWSDCNYTERDTEYIINYMFNLFKSNKLDAFVLHLDEMKYNEKKELFEKIAV